LALAVVGLVIAYFLFNVHFVPGKTLNAVLIGNAIAHWNPFVGQTFLYVTLISEAALLFVAAQTGYLDGPRVMANMAHDYWLPRKFTLLSDRLVSQNGIVLMGVAAFCVIWLSKGSVAFLVVLYSINVFITFTLSQFGMVKHWFNVRKTEKKWFGKLVINGIGLLLTTFILITVTVIKFEEGGWITLVITTCLVGLSLYIKKHYNQIGKEIGNIQSVMNTKMPELVTILKTKIKLVKTENKEINASDSTAVILVNGYSAIGLYSLFYLLNTFHNTYKNFVFISVGVVDSGSFNSHEQLEILKLQIENDLQKYVKLIKELGCHAEYRYGIGTDVSEEVLKLVPEVLDKYPNSTFVGGQLIIRGMYRISRVLHNFTIFSIQRRLYKHGLTTIIIPISLDKAIEVIDVTNKKVGIDSVISVSN